MAGFWSELSRTLRGLESLAADPHRLDADVVGALRSLQYRLHWSSEFLAGVEPPPGARNSHAELADALVDAILLDLHVGQGDGRQLIASLGTPRPPVALFTGSEVIGAELRALADAVLVKPFGIDLLAETVGRLIEDAGPTGSLAP